MIPFINWLFLRPSAKQRYNLGKHVNDRDLAFLYWREHLFQLYPFVTVTAQGPSNVICGSCGHPSHRHAPWCRKAYVQFSKPE